MLASARNTKARQPHVRPLGIKANVIVHAGSLVVNDAGLAAPGRTALNLVGLGRASETIDNTGGANGAALVLVEAGCFQFANSATDPVTDASIGKDVFIVDDETVAATNGANTRSVAGKCFDVDDGGVWVTFD